MDGEQLIGRQRWARSTRRLAALWVVSLAFVAIAAAGAARNASAATFSSEPSLDPPAIELPMPASTPAAGGGQQPSYVLLAPIQAFSRDASFVGKPGPEMIEADGNLVWQRPLGNKVKVDGAERKIVAMDLHTATYEGKSVLVWWQGYITPTGFGNGTWEIVNQHYDVVATVKAPAGYELDFHDMDITANGMAYILGGKVAKANLAGCCGGPVKGRLYDQVLFEVNVATGKTVWKWDPLTHIPFRDSYSKIPSGEPWDPYHLNSISIGPSGNIVLSARNTWATYWIERGKKDNKAIFATLGGKASSFALGPGARFAWQHDVSQLPKEEVSVFDDEAAPIEGKQSRGLLLKLDFVKKTATKLHEYLLPKPEFAGSQGSVELEPDGNVFVGWGQLPYFSEYTSSGKLVYEGSFTGADESYRAYRSAWIGLPVTKPSLSVTGASGGAEIEASWNGATEVVSWQLLAGSSASTLSPAGAPVAKTSFQTSITTSSAGPYYAVQAIDKAGKVLSTSSAVEAG